MSLTGDIRTFSLSAIGRLLHQEKKTGILSVYSDDSETRIYFRSGDIVFISGALAPELSLGALLKEKNLVTDSEIDISLEMAKKENRRLGVVLLENGFVSQEKLINILNHQFKESISKVLTWRTGGFAYQDGLEGFVEDIRLKLDPIRLVAEAEKWKAYRALIPNDQVIFQIKEGALKTKSFAEDGSLRVMLLIDGKRDVSQIMTETGLPRLAIYRALSALVARDAIEVIGRGGISEEDARRDISTVLEYYMTLIHEITANTALELGEKKAHGIMLKSLQNSSAKQLFMDAVVPGDSPSENTRRVSDRLRKSGAPMQANVLEDTFKGAIFQLFQEIYHVLGFKAARDIITRLIAATDQLQGALRSVADRLLPFLHTLVHDETYLSGKKAFSTGRGETRGGPSDDGDCKQSLENTGGATIIAFYGRIIQIVAHEMEAEIGDKVYVLLNTMLEESDYYEKFLSQYHVNDEIQENVERIRKHIAKKGYRLAKNSFVSGFQEILVSLLTEKQRLLGEKSVRSTVVNIEGFLVNITGEAFQPLITNLIPMLKRII